MCSSAGSTAPSTSPATTTRWETAANRRRMPPTLRNPRRAHARPPPDAANAPEWTRTTTGKTPHKALTSCWAARCLQERSNRLTSEGSRTHRTYLDERVLPRRCHGTGMVARPHQPARTLSRGGHSSVDVTAAPEGPISLALSSNGPVPVLYTLRKDAARTRGSRASARVIHAPRSPRARVAKASRNSPIKMSPTIASPMTRIRASSLIG